MSNDKKQDFAIKNPRRQFLGTVGLVGAGAVLASCAPSLAVPPQKQNLDGEIFNFALNLEYLEAAFYLAAVGRLGELDAAGGDSSKVKLPDGYTGKDGKGITDFSPELHAYANETATDEKNHVAAIRSTLGSAAVAQPVLDLSGSFAAAGNAASSGKITGFNPYVNHLFFLLGAFIFEDVGVTAYKGAAKYITDPTNLEKAAGILAVEGYHAGSIRTQLYAYRDTVAAAGLTVGQIVQAISNLRDAVDGSTRDAAGDLVMDTDQGIVSTLPGNPDYVVKASDANIVLADAYSVAFSRTPRQVANIVFLDTTGSATSGGFFPNGLSGSFTNILKL